MDSDSSDDDGLSFVAKGAYGCVVKPALPNREDGKRKWMTYPKNVTKLFFTRKNMKKAYEDSKNMYKLLGHNKGHKTYKYKHTYESSDIPKSVFDKCKKLRKGEPLYPLRLRNLGYDIWNIPKHYKEYRTVPVSVILDQIVKVMTQIQRLVSKHMIHGDVRETNIMVHPKSGDITLIDFDMLYPSDTFYTKAHLGFYCHPPETFLYNHFKQLLQATKDGDDRLVNAIFESEDMLERITKYVEHHSEFEIARSDSLHRSLSVSDLITHLKNSLRFYVTYLDPSFSKEFLQTALRETLLPSFDGYGLAFSLLEFIAHVYPSVTKRVQKDIYTEALKSRLRNGRRSYSDSQIGAIRTTLHELVFEVLEPMVNLEVEGRMMISDALATTTKIVNKFQRLM
jgi:hypothetical protein